MNILEKIQNIPIEGNIYTDKLHTTIYATDASEYREKPLAVAVPKTVEDIRKLILFARHNHTSLIPRAAGTSLSGQVVGSGIVVDISKHFNNIIELNISSKTVRVQPGVNLDELNAYLKPHHLFFGPETSTANRCLMGGMLGNNACGLHSLAYGSTRDHTQSVKVLLSDGSETEFGELTQSEFSVKLKQHGLEGEIYRQTANILSAKANQMAIRKSAPKASIPRRNTGYALDLLLNTAPFTEGAPVFNFAKLLAGSEGTLAFTTEIELKLLPLPPKEVGISVAHFNTLEEALQANLIALQFKPQAVELMDDIILNCTKNNIEQRKNRFFVKGEPAAILIIEFARDTQEEILKLASEMEKAMRKKGYGYHFPLLYGNDTKKVWTVRKAGLGLLSNIPGDAYPVSLIEDTAVDVHDLPAYIADFKQILFKHKLSSVFHAHIGTGELHLRPMLNLKNTEHVKLFRQLLHEVALLVKKYKGSLSGEHGDGRLRGEFIPLMVGQQVYALFKEVKAIWDPNHIMNPNKIVDTPAMNSSLRYKVGEPVREVKTVFDFSKTEGIQRAAEKCNGSGDCRKSHLWGGTLCPSYQATRNERNTTRARANTLREFITRSPKNNPFDHKELYEVMDLCLSCKACKSECPSGVDIAKLKAEFLQHYYDANGVPFRSWLIANISTVNVLALWVKPITNWVFKTDWLIKPIMRAIGFSDKRKIPLLSNSIYRNQIHKWAKKQNSEYPNGLVYIFNDEFTNHHDSHIGIYTIRLLNALGYKVTIPNHTESGRTYLSKGLVRHAKKLAEKNVSLLADLITEKTPLIGIEPSAILTFRDEYPELVGKPLQQKAQKLAKNALLFDEFFEREAKAGRIKPTQFTNAQHTIKLHGHCQQKAIASTSPTLFMLGFPKNYVVSEIPSGCCGMAGSFGYEAEHYEVSIKIGELVLFPAVRKTTNSTQISAPGTSCRHQITDGTGKNAVHPVEIIFNAISRKQNKPLITHN